MTPKEELLLRSFQEFMLASDGYGTSFMAPIIGAVKRALNQYPALVSYEDYVVGVLADYFGIKPETKLSLGDRLKLLREKIGYSQGKLSGESCVMQQTISQIESGKLLNPTAETLSGLSRALGVTLDELYHGSN